MTTVARNPRIIVRERVLNTRRYGFLSIVKMAKATNVTGLVLVVAGNLHTTHSVHEIKHGPQFILVGFHGMRRTRFQVVNLHCITFVE